MVKGERAGDGREVDSSATVWDALERVLDPEMPVISIVQLGLIHRVEIENDRCLVEYQPTFLGCPASQRIAEQIADTLRALALEPDVRTCWVPPWTTERISASGREALRRANIAVEDARERAVCPRCDSSETSLVTSFGATRCRAVRRCSHCNNLFDQMKLVETPETLFPESRLHRVPKARKRG